MAGGRVGGSRGVEVVAGMDSIPPRGARAAWLCRGSEEAAAHGWVVAPTAALPPEEVSSQSVVQ